MTMSQSHSKQKAHNKALVRSYAKNASPAQLALYKAFYLSYSELPLLLLPDFIS